MSCCLLLLTSQLQAQDMRFFVPDDMHFYRIQYQDI